METSTPQRLPLARFLRDHRDHILERWTAEVLRLPRASELARPALIDHVPELLDALIGALEGGDDAALAHSNLVASNEHATQRLDQGYDLRDVVAEYGVLRKVIEQLWELADKDDAAHREYLVLDRAIDRAIAVSVNRFTTTRERTLVAVDRISAAAFEHGDATELLPRLLEALMQTTEAVDAVVVLLSDGQTLHVRAAAGLPEAELSSAAIDVGRGFEGRIAREQRALHVEDAAHDETVQLEPLRAGFKGLYGMPLMFDGRAAGVALIGSRTARVFSTDDRILFRTMATRATAFIAQHQLLLREREARALLETVLAASPVGIAFVDTQLRYVRINEALAAVNGRTAAQHVGRTVREVLGDAATPLETQLRGVLTTGQPKLGVEFAAPPPNGAGGLRHWLANFYPVHTEHGAVAGVGVIVLDVTEKARATEQTRRQAAELDAIIEALPDAVLVGDARGVRLANQAALRMLGFDDVGQLNMPTALLAERLDVRDPATSEPVPFSEQAFGRALRGLTTDREVSFRNARTEQPATVRALGVPIRLGDDFIGAVALLSDITERKHREVDLRAHAERTRLALEATRAGLFDHDLVADTIRWDARTHELFGVPQRTKVTLDVVLARIHPEDQQRVWQAFADAKDPAKRTPYIIEYRTRDGAGAERWLMAHGTVLFDEGGTPLRLVGTVIDVTDRKRTEVELKRTSEFREQFIGVLGHDLRNPLGAIRASAELLLRREGVSSAQAGVLKRIVGSADRMTRMISDILDFARGRLGGGFPIQRRRVDLHELIRAVGEELHVAHPQRQLQLELPGDGWGDWDADRMSQVLSNLIGNAFQHGAHDAPVRVSSRPEAKHIVVDVTNRGGGIAPEQTATLFEPFRTGSPRAGSGTSLGLGLWISREIVVAHGGSITVHSNGETTFRVTLPRSTRATPRPVTRP